MAQPPLVNATVLILSVYASNLMRFLADFHIHSHYSRATSREMNLVSLSKWGQMKGLTVMGTGDFTHPRWFAELQDKLEPAESGLYRLQPKYEHDIQAQVPTSCQQPLRFLLTVEISCIYSKNDWVRKMHCLVVAPSLQVASTINTALQKIGNLKADGRPILGLDAKTLLKIVLEASPDCLFIPAHAWTPYFSVFGSKSGFDTLTEAFEELTPHVYAIETGLSSDPAMNWRLAQLDTIALISNSDAHSPGKLGREANVFETDLTYPAIVEAIKTNNRTAFVSTIEFFPEEGKYHLDGHRLCQVRLTPAESKRYNLRCPKCQKEVTIGVLHRVAELADRAEGFKPTRARPFTNIIPLPEIIAEVEGVGVATQRVQKIYYQLVSTLGNEFSILLNTPLIDIAQVSSPLLAQGIERMRTGKIQVQAGYDGEYGKMSVVADKDRKRLLGQQPTLF